MFRTNLNSLPIFTTLLKSNISFYSVLSKCKKHIERSRNTDRKMYLLEFAGGFVIQVLEFHANSLNKSIRAYLSNHFNALFFSLKFYNISSFQQHVFKCFEKLDIYC